MTDDNELAGIDLDAWEAPPPPAGLADAVVARMHKPRRELPRAPVARRRWWIAAAAAGAVAVGAASVVAIGRWGTEPAPAAGNGDVFAARATHLELAPSAVDLDQGAELRWSRAAHRLIVAQPRGAATWRVDGSDTLVIDAGAAVASVEASGASLRVEVHMSPADVRTIKASAGAAGAAALVTVIIYSGSAKVSGAGETVTVASGGTVEVQPGAAPREVLAVAGPDRVRELEARVRALEAELTGALDDSVPVALGGPQFDDTCDEASCARTNYAEPCCEGFRPAADTRALDRTAFRRGIALVERDVLGCADGSFAGRLTATLDVAADGRVSRVRLRPSRASVSRCVTRALLAARFDPSGIGGSHGHAFTFARPTCDPSDLISVGSEAYTRGEYAKALADFERAHTCAPNRDIALRAFMAACSSRNLTKASHYYQLYPNQLHQALGVCIRNGITDADLVACDADALLARGDARYKAADFAQALARYEEALACRSDKRATVKAVMAACKLRDQTKAAELYRRNPTDAANAIPICSAAGLSLCDSSTTDAEAAYRANDFARALREYQRALSCSSTDAIAMPAFLAACQARDRAAAIDLARRFPDAARPNRDTCAANGINDDVLKLDPAPPSSQVQTVAPRNLPPTIVSANRIAGETKVAPDDATRRKMVASGRDKVVGSFKLCIGTDGAPLAIQRLKSSGFPDYDAALQRAMRDWRFRPFTDDAGRPSTVCTAYTFIYTVTATPTCDAADLTTKGTDHYSAGNYAAALSMFEQALACKRDSQTILKAFMSACRIPNRDKARKYYKMDRVSAQRAMQICVQQGIVESDFDAR